MSKLITLSKAELPLDVNQTGRLYSGKDFDIAVFETNCEKGRFAFLMQNGRKISRAKRICSGNITVALKGEEKLQFGKFTFEI